MKVALMGCLPPVTVEKELVSVEPPPFYLFDMFVCAFDTCASLAAWRLLNTNGKPRWDVDLTMKCWDDSVVLFLNE